MLASLAPAPCVPEDVEKVLQPTVVAAAERARQRELASYLNAAGVTQETARLDPDSAEGIRAPVTSLDPVLTALVQLAPLRLNCDRSFLSLLDGNTQFIIAEATQTTPLQPGVAAEGLFLGVMMMESSWGVCPNTMNIFCDETGELAADTGNIVADRSRYIIRDLQAEDHYREKPYVADFPHMRSYYEVPLISPLGYVIGGYCVTDNKLRKFDDETLRVLTEVSQTIMAHLERVRRERNHSRSEKLIRGLDAFIQEETNFRNSRKSSALASPAPQSSEEDARSMGFRRRESSSTTATQSTIATEPTSYRRNSQAQQLTITTDSAQSAEPPTPAQPPFDETGENVEMRRAFHRSAQLIRDAMNMDGMVFLDACPVGFASRDASINRQDYLDPFADSQEEFLHHQSSSEVAPILAQSTILSTGEALTIPEGLLYRAIGRYKTGYVFSADEYGVFEKRTIPNHDRDSTDLSRTSSRGHEADAAELFQHFPGACSIIFLPMWHFQKEKWFAAAIGWTSDPKKSFDPSDATYLSAFANSITAEVLRLETLAVSKAKSDFISSISHEMRSPLHGILATTELLRETISNREERSLLEMVSSSGTTLLDTMDHLLDHAKINSRSSARNGHASRANKKKNAKQLNAGTVFRACNLAELVEGVVQDIVMGHTRYASHSNGLSSILPDSTMPSADLEPPPIVVINIQAGHDWNLILEVGAWKRIILNLLGNALKYTPSGSISVNLSIVGDRIVFAVQDTGIGMSSEYQKYHLYSPFRQENPLSVGTGLGLSIVQQIVDLQGGVIDVQSQKGVGTLVSVAVPMPERPKTIQENGHASEDDLKRLHGLTLGIIGRPKTIDDDDELSGPTQSLKDHHEKLQQSVACIAENWLGMKVAAVSAPSASVDIYLAESLDLENLVDVTPESQLYQPLVILHSHTAKKSPLLGTTLRIPFGPKRLAQALLSALEQPVGSTSNVPTPKAEQPVSIGTDTARPLVTRENQVPLTTSLQNLALASGNLPTPPEDAAFTKQAEAIQNPYVSSSLAENELPVSIPQLSDSSLEKLPHVLIVDDNPISIRILATLLKRLFIPHLSASNGLEAFHLYTSQLHTNPFDVVLMDISMPVMDGFTSTREIRAFEREHKAKAKAKIVALTGLGSRESEEEAGRCGMDAFLVKPVKLATLRELLVPQTRL